MRLRGGFGVYINVPGLTAIDQVRAVLAEIGSGSRARSRARHRLMQAGLDADQAWSLVSAAIKLAESDRKASAA